LRDESGTPLSQVGTRGTVWRDVERPIAVSLERASPKDSAGEATLASSGVVENAVRRR